MPTTTDVAVNLQLNILKLKTMLTRNKINFFYSILIYLNHFAYGITTNMVGATLVDLRFIFSVSLNVIAYMPVAQGIGYLIGSLAAYLYRYFNRQLMLIFFVLLMAASIAFLPYYGTLLFALSALVLNGIGSGAWDSATSIWLVDMWPIGNSAILQGSQFMYGLGSIVAPMLVSPFVYGEANVTADNQTLTVEDRIHALTYPFAVCGLIQTIVPVFLFILFFVHRYEKPNHQRLKNEEAAAEEAPEEADEVAAPNGSIQDQSEVQPPARSSIPNRRSKLLLCGLCLATYGTVEIGHFAFSAALFQHLAIHLSAATSAHIMGILSSTYTLGRLTSAFLSLHFQPDTIIGYHYVILVGSLSALYYGRGDLWWITIGTACLGYGFSAMWPAIFAFTERHLRLTDRVCSLFSFLSGTVSLVIPLILGQSFKANPLILFYLEAIFLAISLVIYLTVRIWISTESIQNRHRRRRLTNVEHSHVY